jgi:hypothetical protein
MLRCCRTVALFAVSLCCTYLDSGASRSIFFCSASNITSAATKVLVMLATPILVCGVSGVPAASLPTAPDQSH